MIISDRARLWLYILMSVLPLWVDWFKLSTDVSVRGLMMPILSSINAAVIVALAKTAAKMDAGSPIQVVAPVGEPLKVTQTNQPKPKARK